MIENIFNIQTPLSIIIFVLLIGLILLTRVIPSAPKFLSVTKLIALMLITLGVYSFVSGIYLYVLTDYLKASSVFFTVDPDSTNTSGKKGLAGSIIVVAPAIGIYFGWKGFSNGRFILSNTQAWLNWNEENRKSEKVARQGEQKLKDSEQSSSTFFEKLIGFLVIIGVFILIIGGLTIIF